MLGRPQRRCPQCQQLLAVSWDMWGEFYICEDCGFAEDDDLAPEAAETAALLLDQLPSYRAWLATGRR